MLQKRLRFFCLIGCLLSIVSFKVMAKTDIILSLQAPPEREFVMPPGGYGRCYMVPAEYRHGTWINSHRVCEYYGRRGTATWVSGYWVCDRMKHHKKCAHWEWVGSHWEGRPRMAYGYGPQQPMIAPPPPPPPVQVVVQPAPPPAGHHHH